LWFSVWQDRRVRNRAQAIIMGVVAAAFAVGVVVFAVNHQRQASTRSALSERGIVTAIEQKTFFERDTRRLNPNTGRSDSYSDDQVLYSFVDVDGEEVFVAQPIAEDRYDDLGPISTLTAVYLEEDAEGAELLDDGEFVANAVPYWLFALICAVFAMCSGASALLSTRPKRRT